MTNIEDPLNSKNSVVEILHGLSTAERRRLFECIQNPESLQALKLSLEESLGNTEARSNLDLRPAEAVEILDKKYVPNPAEKNFIPLFQESESYHLPGFALVQLTLLFANAGNPHGMDNSRYFGDLGTIKSFFSSKDFPFTKTMGETLESMKDIEAFLGKINKIAKGMSANLEVAKKLEKLEALLNFYKDEPTAYLFMIEQLQYFLKEGHFDLTKVGVGEDSGF